MSRTSRDVSDKHILHVTDITVGTKLERILHQIKRKIFNLEKTCNEIFNGNDRICNPFTLVWKQEKS